MKHKILIHSPNLSTPGGKQNYFAALQDKFENDIEFFFYGPQGKKESLFKTVTRMFTDYWSFYKKLKKNNYDLVHLNPSLNFKSFFRDSLFAAICTLAGTKMVVFWRGWGWDFEKKYVRHIVPFFRLTFGKASAMICLAQEFSDKLVEYGFKKPIYLETTVVDDDVFNYSNNTPARPHDKLSLLFMARVERVKGIYEMIDAIDNLNKRFDNIELNLAGTGGELENAKAYAAEKQIQNINFLGWVGGEQKAQLLHDCDIFLLPTYHGEGMPNCILEAMATAKPIITTPIGGVKDFFQDGKMGFLVKTKDTDDLEQKVEALIHRPDLRQEMGVYNKSYATNRFTAKVVCKRLEQIYGAVIAESYTYAHSYPS